MAHFPYPSTPATKPRHPFRGVSAGRQASDAGHLVARNLACAFPAAACKGKCLGAAPPRVMPFSPALGGESSWLGPRPWSW
eukprot:bmy_22371T0